LVINGNSPSAGDEFIGIPEPVSDKSMPCPFCCSGVIAGIRILPLSFDNLERAIEVRKQCVQNQTTPTTTSGDKRSRDEEDEEYAFRQIESESSFLLLSHTTLGGGADRHCHRTGRWSQEELAFVDYIVGAFDQGALPIPHGVKLNDLLGDILLCKSSRLTKKMKNAKLSTRSYSFKSPICAMDRVCCATFSSLQEHFLASVPSEPLQLELSFNMTKLWRTHFSNLCLQVGYELMDAHDWVASLEQMESKASEAEDNIRKARRRRMSIALRTDVGEGSNPGVFIGGLSARDANMQPPPAPAQLPKVSSLDNVTAAIKTDMQRNASHVTMSEKGDNDDDDDDDTDFLAALERTAVGGGGSSRSRLASTDIDFGRARLGSADMDFGFMIDDMMDPIDMIPNLKDCPQAPGDCGPFLEHVVSYMETNTVDFQHVDVWVPSYMGDNGNVNSGNSNDPSKLRLFPAGQVTRADLDATLKSQLDEFGVYSTNFSFAPGHGLPGRVYTSGEPAWECRIDLADPHLFERAGGASVYGVKTAVGIPLVAEGIGTIVVAMYSTLDLEEDKLMLHKFVEDFKMWTPEPKWKLVIDLGSPTPKPCKPVPPPPPSRMVHFVHGKPSQVNLKPTSASLPATMPTPSAATLSMPTPSAATLPTAAMIHRPHAVKTEPAKFPKPDANLEDDEEERISSLLGDHMPMSDSPSAALLPHFMSLRLLLLRNKSHRAPPESEMLDILKRSFRGYSKDNRWSGSELAALLAKDWVYLQPNPGISPSNEKPVLQYQNHGPAFLGTMPMPPLTYSLPPPAAHPGATGMVVNQHGPDRSNIFPLYQEPPRSRSVSTSLDSTANVVPEL
jgi:hypothetical protein